MIAARLAGGNLFFCFFGGGGFWEHSEHSEHSDFLRGFFLRDSFFGGGGVCFGL